MSVSVVAWMHQITAGGLVGLVSMSQSVTAQASSGWPLWKAELKAVRPVCCLIVAGSMRSPRDPPNTTTRGTFGISWTRSHLKLRSQPRLT